jgi:hypothetical protein
LGFLERHDEILDIGCGSSRILLALPGAIGLDILQRKLRWLRPRHSRLIQGSCERLPGSGLERVTWGEAFASFPMFSRDGARLVFCSSRNAAAARDLNVFVADWVA